MNFFPLKRPNFNGKQTNMLTRFLMFVIPIPLKSKGIVENIGVEPMTSCVQGRRSSQLS